MTSPGPHRLIALALASIAAAGCSVSTRLPRHPRGPVVLEIRGDVQGAPFQLGNADLAELEQRTFRGVDPAAPGGAEVRFSGVDLGLLVGDRLALTGDADTVIVHTSDEEAVPVPLSAFRQLRPVLADRADGAPLGARVVAWPNVAQPGVSSDPRAPSWWARRVTALEVVSGPRTVGQALHLPEFAPPGARAGAALFGDRCLACHRVQHGGGRRGPDLTRAADRLDRPTLRQKLEGHPGWVIPGQAEPTPEAAAQLDAFLRTVAAVDALGAPTVEPATEPAPEPGPPEPRPGPQPPGG
jgi:mono/diheme cytochrome c family protein